MTGLNTLALGRHQSTMIGFDTFDHDSLLKSIRIEWPSCNRVFKLRMLPTTDWWGSLPAMTVVTEMAWGILQEKLELVIAPWVGNSEGKWPPSSEEGTTFDGIFHLHFEFKWNEWSMRWLSVGKSFKAPNKTNPRLVWTSLFFHAVPLHKNRPKISRWQ